MTIAPNLPTVLAEHPLGHLLVAADGALLIANAAATGVLELGTEPVAGRQWSSLFDGSAPDVIGRHRVQPLDFEGALASGRAVRLRLWTVGADWADAAAALVVVQPFDSPDTTQQLLRESELRFSTMAHRVPGAMLEYTLHADGSDAVTYMSPRGADLWEIPAERVMADATRLWAVVVPEDLPAMQASLMRSGVTLAPWYHEWRIVTPSGRVKWLQGSGEPLRTAEGSTRWNAFILDVSERKAQEEAAAQVRAELRRAQLLEALGRLSGGIAHDFNNQLAVILGCGESALCVAVPGTEQELDLRELLLAVERASALTRRLLTFAKRQPTRSVPVDASKAVDSLIALLRRTIPPAITLDLTTPGSELLVDMDPVQFDQCVANLVLNAHEAMPDGGTVTVTLAAEERDGRRGAGLRVVDTGARMPADVAARVFEPFYTTKGTDHGTGLSPSTVSSTVSSAVARAGGVIEPASDAGPGASVLMWLPLRTPSEEVTKQATSRAPAALPVSVLVVEDDEQLRGTVTRLLRQEGVVVYAVATPRAALALTEDGTPFNAILSDVVLPGMHGVELCAEITQRRGAVPVLFMTGFIDQPGVLEQLENSVHGVLAKPFTNASLLEALRGLGRATPGILETRG